MAKSDSGSEGRAKRSHSHSAALRYQEEGHTSRSRIFSHLSATVLASILVLSIGQFEFESFRGILVDVLYRSRIWNEPQKDIELVAYDDESSSRYEASPILPAEELISVLETVAKGRPRAVLVMASLNQKHYSSTELRFIAQGLAKFPFAVVAYPDEESLGELPPPELAQVSSYLPGIISRDAFSFGADSVTRRVMLTIEGIPTAYRKLACYLRNEPDALCFTDSAKWGRVGNSTYAYIHWQGGPKTYPSIKTLDVVRGEIPSERFHNKVVLIGSELQSKKGADHVLSPYSREPFQTSALEAAAHSIASLTQLKVLTKSPEWLDWFLALVVGVLTVNMVLFLPPGRGILFVVAELITIVTLSWVSLFLFRFWFDACHPLVIACLGYYLVIPYRLVDEYRKRWHYQEKSELMAQLEQLKSNFLSLVSHDLKTPIARIQGNAELALTASEPLTDKQKKSLNAIIQTTEDLSEYVEMVLDLTRIESAQIPIQKSTRDINATVMEVVENKRALAQEKNITLQTQLEPIFSFKYDAKLMRRVLSNLLENAIKYSPPGSTICFHSKEENSWIRISVEDQGVGISPEEQPKVFEKFYRCETTSKEVKGTGLGLYLVKYFVELHEGMIELRSELGRGSTFTVSLPI